MEHTLIVAGIGPGSRDYILPKALDALTDSRFLAGSRRALADYARPGQETFPVTGDLQSLETWISASLQKGDVTVLVSGDPGYYSLLPWLKRKFPQAAMEVIPGISSVQMAFCRIAEPWQEAELLSFHGRRPAEGKMTYEKGKKLAFLTDGEHNPAYICRHLLSLGWPETARIDVLEHLSYENENKAEITLSEGCSLAGFSESILVVMG